MEFTFWLGKQSEDKAASVYSEPHDRLVADLGLGLPPDSQSLFLTTWTIWTMPALDSGTLGIA